MSKSDAQIRAQMKYRSKNYDQLNLQLKKGLRDRWKAHAEAQGLSLTAYITKVMEAACGSSDALVEGAPIPLEVPEAAGSDTET